MLLTPLWLERLPVKSRESHDEVTMAKKATTLTPSLVLKNDNPYLVFVTPGGDQQDQ